MFSLLVYVMVVDDDFGLSVCGVKRRDH